MVFMFILQTLLWRFDMPGGYETGPFDAGKEMSGISDKVKTFSSSEIDEAKKWFKS